MKNTILLGLVLLLAFSGFSFFSNTLKRSAFESEADSLLRVAKDLTPETAPDLLINKAEQYDILLLEEDVLFDVQRTDVDTQTSVKLEKSGLRVITNTATLNFTFTQSFLGFERSFSYSKSRNFTRSAELAPRLPENYDPFDDSP